MVVSIEVTVSVEDSAIDCAMDCIGNSAASVGICGVVVSLCVVNGCVSNASSDIVLS